MIKNQRLISILLLIIIIFSSISVLATDTEFPDYIEGYEYGLIKGKIDGKSIGVLDGKNNTNILSEALYKKIKCLLKELEKIGKSKEYIKGFKDGYTQGFQDSYDKVFKPDIPEEHSIVHGPKDFGRFMGEVDGYLDYKSERKNNWEKTIPSDRELNLLFEIGLEDVDYRERFIKVFKKTYQSAYEKAFQQCKLGGRKKSYEDGKLDGQKYAKLLAEKEAIYDFFIGYKNNYYKGNMQTENEIISEYNLHNDTDEYRGGFLATYCEYYELYYMRKYRDLNLKDVENKYAPDENGYENGKEVGLLKGEYAAIMDIISRKANHWQRHKVKDFVIIEKYGLDFQSKNYSISFIMGYWDSFLRSYNETYKEQAQEQNTTQTITQKLPIGGGKVSSSDKKFYIEVEPGTYYNDVIVTIDTVPKINVSATSKRHTKVSNYYNLKLLNMDRTYDDKKTIKIGFESYGHDKKYGIYKYHYNKWIYIPSKYEEDYLTAEINTANLNEFGNIYVIRIDNELPNFYETRGHWAKDEIMTYTKREIVYGYPDDTFKPNNNITRREFLEFLRRLYDWYPPYDSSNIQKFKDYKDFGYAEKAISYATNDKLISGYSDNTFRPNNPISYKEVEIIMSKVLKDKNFKWNYFADKMMYENGVRSKSKDNMNRKITRAEFVFMLHRLNEWKY